MRAALCACLAAGYLLATQAAAVAVAPSMPTLALTDPPAAESAPTDYVDTALQEFERLGRDLYRADRAAWLTTDLLREQGLSRPEDIEGNPDGWVTLPTVEPDIWRVAYVALVDGLPQVFADGTVDFSQPEPMASLRRNEPYRSLDPDEIVQRAIRRDAVERDWMSCSRSPYNTATIPDGKGGWNVYLMPPQTSLTAYPMGGFHRFSYNQEGRFVANYSHTLSCIEQSEASLPRGAKMESLVITHITSPTPNEFHVFMSLSYKKPVFVGTADRKFWTVVEGDIVFLSNIEDGG